MSGTRIDVEQGESFSDALRRAWRAAHPIPPVIEPKTGPGTKDLLGSGE